MVSFLNPARNGFEDRIPCALLWSSYQGTSWTPRCNTILNDGLLKDLPVVGWVVAAGKTASTVRDYFLIRKILRFLAGLSDVPKAERDSFVVKVEEDNKFGNRVAETLIMLLDRYDHINKAALMSKLFYSYGKGEIDYSDFLRLSTAVDRAFMPDLSDLLDYFADKGNDPKLAKRNVYMSGLSDFYVLTEDQQKRVGLEYPQIYHFNQYAQKLAKCVLGELFHGDRW
jgi:hypothetical protein